MLLDAGLEFIRAALGASCDGLNPRLIYSHPSQLYYVHLYPHLVLARHASRYLRCDVLHVDSYSPSRDCIALLTVSDLACRVQC